MNVRLKRLDPALPLPKYETSGSVGFDFLAREEITIAPKSLGLIPGNVIVEVPEGFMLIVTLRSSAPRRHGLLMPHGLGIIDHDYSGPNDEIKIQVYNFTDEPVTIRRGDRIAQGVLVPIEKAEFEEASEIKKQSRGGFGSTG